MEEEKVLDPEVIENIQAFSGISEPTTGERMLSEGKALQRVQTQYTTAIAVQQPRSIARVVKNVLEEAKLAGPAFYYRWEVTTKTGRKVPVQGPSIDLAMCVARNYGNCAVDIEGAETATHYMLKGIFIDLETGFTVPRLFRQRKKQDIGSRYGDDRAEDMIFQIAQSKAQRNAIVKAMPNWLIEKAIEEARTAEINRIKPENLVISRAKVLDFFGTYGIAQDRIEAKVGQPIDNWTAENIVDLRAGATALKEGRISADELFPAVLRPEKQREPTKEKVSSPKPKRTKPARIKKIFEYLDSVAPNMRRGAMQHIRENSFKDLTVGDQDKIEIYFKELTESQSNYEQEQEKIDKGANKDVIDIEPESELEPPEPGKVVDAEFVEPPEMKPEPQNDLSDKSKDKKGSQGHTEANKTSEPPFADDSEFAEGPIEAALRTGKEEKEEKQAAGSKKNTQPPKTKSEPEPNPEQVKALIYYIDSCTDKSAALEMVQKKYFKDLCESDRAQIIKYCEDSATKKSKSSPQGQDGDIPFD